VRTERRRTLKELLEGETFAVVGRERLREVHAPREASGLPRGAVTGVHEHDLYLR
jgi:hypothetical protein